MSEGAGPAAAVEQRVGGREAGGPRTAWLGGGGTGDLAWATLGARGVGPAAWGSSAETQELQGIWIHAVSPVDRVGKESFATTISDAGWE